MFAPIAAVLCEDADHRVEGETALAVELWLAEGVSVKWLFWLGRGAVMKELWDHQLAVSLDVGVWAGERDCECGLP